MNFNFIKLIKEKE